MEQYSEERKPMIITSKPRCSNCFKILPLNEIWFFMEDKHFCSHKCRDIHSLTKVQIQNLKISETTHKKTYTPQESLSPNHSHSTTSTQPQQPFVRHQPS